MECDVIRFKRWNFSDLYPIQLGWQKHRPDWSYHYALKGDYLIHYIISGKGVAEINGVKYPLEKNQYFIIKKGDRARYTSDHTDPWHYIWICFDGNFAKNFDTISTTGNISPEIFMNLMSVFDRHSHREEYIVSQIYLLYIQLTKNDEIKSTPEIIKDYIDTNFEKKLLVDDIARLFNINRKHLSKIFSEKYGMSTKKYITYIKMQNALMMLKKGATVKYTAEHLSFDDPFAFSKAFKKEMGYSPKDIKRKISQK